MMDVIHRLRINDLEDKINNVNTSGCLDCFVTSSISVPLALLDIYNADMTLASSTYLVKSIASGRLTLGSMLLPAYVLLSSESDD